MRRADEIRLDPEIVAALDAIDATLAGDPVDPDHAEYAELALLLATNRPVASDQFSRSLDDRVQRRFESAERTRRRRGLRWPFVPAIGLATVAAVAVVVALSSGGATTAVSSRSSSSGGTKGTPVPAASAGASRAAGVSGGRGTADASPGSRASTRSVPLTPAQTSAAAPFSTSVNRGNATTYPGLRLPANGRKVVQSSQLALSAPSSRVDDVAQQVFDVVGAESGFVNSSSVTATGGPNGYAQFELSVPSRALAQTMTQLSRLRYAQVVSRTDNTTDVTNQYNGATGELAQAQALRTSLLKQLQNAVTQTQISSLQAQLRDVNAKISSADSTLRSLNHQISYSTISVTIQGTVPAAGHSGGGGGFTIGKAAHDAGKVLTVAAGIALIVLAALVPIGLLTALGWWIGAALRRRRREQALDVA